MGPQPETVDKCTFSQAVSIASPSAQKLGLVKECDPSLTVASRRSVD